MGICRSRGHCVLHRSKDDIHGVRNSERGRGLGGDGESSSGVLGRNVVIYTDLLYACQRGLPDTIEVAYLEAHTYTGNCDLTRLRLVAIDDEEGMTVLFHQDATRSDFVCVIKLSDTLQPLHRPSIRPLPVSGLRSSLKGRKSD